MFTSEEEIEISSTVVERSEDGMEITWNSLQDMLKEHMEMLMATNPMRDSSTHGSLLNKHFVRRFAKRNNLLGYIHIKNVSCVQGTHTHQCNQCGKRFTFKNELVKHLKT